MWVEGQNGTGGGDPLTPSNSTPAAIAQSHVYEAQGNGYAIASYYNLNTPALYDPTLLGSGYFYKVTDPNNEYAYRKKMPYIYPVEVYTEAIKNTTKSYILKNSAGGKEGKDGPLNYWLITAAFKTGSTAETRGGTWLVVGELDDRANKRTLVELQKDSAVTNLTVTLNQNWSTLIWAVDIQTTATAYYYEIRIIRLTDNITGY